MQMVDGEFFFSLYVHRNGFCVAKMLVFYIERKNDALCSPLRGYYKYNMSVRFSTNNLVRVWFIGRFIY